MADLVDQTDDHRRAPARQQIQRLAIILGIMFALLAAGYYAFLRLDYEPLFEGLKPADASAVVSELTEQGVRYRLQDGGATILVESGKRDAARLAILGSDVSSKGLVGFELFDQSEMGLTDFAQKIKYQRALQGELARSIMMMDGMEAARVHIAIPERAMFRGSEAGPTAAVTIATADGSDPAPESIDGIRQLVAAAVPELLPSSVVVLNEQGRILSVADTDGTEKASPATGYSDAAAIEAHYQEKATAALDALMGTGRLDLVLSLETISSATPATGADEVSPSQEPGQWKRIRVAVIGSEAFAGPERERIGAALSAVLPAELFSVQDLTFLDRAPDDPAVPAPPGFAPDIGEILKRLGLADLLATRTGAFILAGGGGVILFGIFGSLFFFRRKRKGLTAEEHREFAELLRLEFAPAEGVPR